MFAIRAYELRPWVDDVRVFEVNGYTIKTWYEGLTCFHIEKDGQEIYHGYSTDEIIKRIGFNPFE